MLTTTPGLGGAGRDTNSSQTIQLRNLVVSSISHVATTSTTTTTAAAATTTTIYVLLPCLEMHHAILMTSL